MAPKCSGAIRVAYPRFMPAEAAQCLHCGWASNQLTTHIKEPIVIRSKPYDPTWRNETPHCMRKRKVAG